MDEQRKWNRLDARRTPGLKGRGPDSDEAADGTADSGRAGKPRSTGYRHTAEGGMWRRSAYLACNAGVPLRSDERGLPPGYATGPTWQRAAREANQEVAALTTEQHIRAICRGVQA